MAEAEEVLKASEGKNLHAYIVVSLLTGARAVTTPSAVTEGR